MLHLHVISLIVGGVSKGKYYRHEGGEAMVVHSYLHAGSRSTQVDVPNDMPWWVLIIDITHCLLIHHTIIDCHQ